MHAGIYEPYSNAKSALSVVSNQVSKHMGIQGFTPFLLEDTTLLSLVESYIPSSHWLSPPIHIVYRIYSNFERYMAFLEAQRMTPYQHLQTKITEPIPTSIPDAE